ncbi:MAG: hypothetical protein JJE37_07675 [Methyloceanibacter sp.]|nr:hypothetical protein [Methyloceanibacter sp.]
MNEDDITVTTGELAKLFDTTPKTLATLGSPTKTPKRGAPTGRAIASNRAAIDPRAGNGSLSRL